MNTMSPSHPGSAIRINVPSPIAGIKKLVMNTSVIKRPPNLHQTLIDELVIDSKWASVWIDTLTGLHEAQMPMLRAESKVVV